MANEPRQVQSSPFVFLKWMIVVELLFAVVPLLLVYIFRARSGYEELVIARSLPFDLLLASLMGALQVLILAVGFAYWSIRVYEIGPEEVRRADLGPFQGRTLARIQAIGNVATHWGPLGRRLGYGSIWLERPGGESPVSLRDIPDPERWAERIRELVVAAASAPAVRPALPGPSSAAELIEAGESQFVEFKSSFQWDYRQQRVNKALHEPVMKNLAGFMNSNGGYLILGVDDEGQPLGLEPDLSSLGKGNVDGFELRFNTVFSNMIGVEYRHLVDVSFPSVGGKQICVLAVHTADEPVYLRDKGEEKFYIRAGNASQPLSVSKALTYIRRRFG